MKEYSKTLLGIIILIMAGVAAFALITFSYREEQVDMLMVNDLVETVKENWDSLDTLDMNRFGTEIIVFSSDNSIVCSTAVHELKDINSADDALREGCICLSIHKESRFMGTIVIPNPDRTGFKTVRIRLLAASGILILVTLSAGLIYGSYVQRTIIRPFRKMEQFAENVAYGNLDEPLMLEQNNLFGKFTGSFDIMREELKASRRRETALKLKEKELIASLSHDIKTPITGIKLLCELLSVKTEDRYLLEKINNIHQKAEQINVLVSDLLTSSLDDLGEMNVDCHDESSAILHQLVTEHDSRNLVNELSVPECMLAVDRIRLSQIIGNIISNSYKYAGTAIDIGYRFRDNYLEMSIRDYGKGISEEEISLVINRFYRGSNAVGKDGSGLGLYISSQLMEKMNGELICSNLEDGFQVTILIALS
ncbi:MAG: HAMP domain-containing histidine kinase [Oscillospiraceae bacterium]|nr:HAMP domain-containing histidine kinase [Oscillospiraceae bacterium]